MKKLQLFLFLFSSLQIFGQYSVSGTVTDANDGEPIVGVNIFVSELSVGTVSDINGKYIINDLPNREIVIRYSFIGYQTMYKTITIKNKSVKFDIVLETQVIEGEEFVVSGNFIATQHQSSVSISTLKADQILKSGSPSLIAAMAEIPGVDFISKGPGIGTPVIRGLSLSNILFLNNSIPVQNYQFSENHPFMVDEFGIGQIEVIKGPASLIYGSGAVGGAINLIPEAVAPQGDIAGDFGLKYLTNTQGVSTNLGVKGNQKGIVWGIRGGINSNKDYIQGNGLFAPNSRFNRQSLKLNTGLVRNFGSFRLFYEYNKDKLGLTNEPAINAVTENERENKVWYQDLTNHLLISQNSFYLNDFKINFDLGYQFNNRQLTGLEELPVLVNMTLQTLSYRLKSTWSINENAKLIFGIQGMNQKNENGEAPQHVLPDATLFDFAGFAMGKYHFGEYIIIEAGFRYSYRKINVPEQPAGGHDHDEPDHEEDEVLISFNNDFKNLSGSLGSTFELSEKLFLRINFASAFRAPNIAELTQYGVHGTRFEAGNSNLSEQQNFEGDLGLHYHSKHATFDVSGFYNHINNYIHLAPTTDSTDEGLTIYRYTQANSRLYGTEASIHYHPHPIHWLHIKATYSLVIGELVSGGYLPFIPAQKIRFELKFTKDRWKALSNIFIKVGTNIVFAQNNASEFENNSTGYNLIDLGLGFDVKLKKQFLSFGITGTNLFNIEYFDHLSTLQEVGVLNMGRNVVFYLKIPFGLKS